MGESRPFRKLSTRQLRKAKKHLFKEWMQLVDAHYQILTPPVLKALELINQELDARKEN